VSKTLKNTTGSDVIINDVGQTVPAGGEIEIQPQDYLLYRASDDVETLLNAGTLEANDGVDDLAAARGIDFIKNTEDAFGLRFAASPERSNGFIKKTIPEVIEESALNAGSSRYAIIFAYNGSASNKWLEMFQSVSSEFSPFVVAEIGEVASLSISTKINTTATVTLYRNSISIDSITITSAKLGVKTGLSHSLAATDTLSAKVTSGSANDVVFVTNIKVL
jgi:hypothetical protein